MDNAVLRIVMREIRSRRLGGDMIAASLWEGTSDLREEECEDKCNGEDHCERTVTGLRLMRTLRESMHTLIRELEALA